MANSPPSQGGFILSPPASSVVSNSSSSKPTLPHPRDTPLRPGGSKESTFIRYVDQQLLQIQRRFAKRTTPSTDSSNESGFEKGDAWGDVKGYSSMKGICRDVEELLSVIWVSGTPSLQVSYLISMGLLVGSVVQNMPPTPRSLFRLLNKLDHAFASLLQGEDVESGERLPGFLGGRGVSGTEKVRIRSLVERTRIDVIAAFKKAEFVYEEPEEEKSGGEEKDDIGTDGELILEGDYNEGVDEQDDSWDMQLARVYDRTIVLLGDSLEEPSIGVITENRVG